MAKFGLFASGSPRPLQQYEGDRLIQYVQIVRDHEGHNVELVATIKLTDGQFIKKISRARER